MMKSNVPKDTKGVQTLEEAKALLAKIDRAKLRLNARMLALKVAASKAPAK
ncbi:hypothetical protein QWY82_00960 [Simiduia curdlanivorans]|uniref:Transposase n=1 Tax=Simiduia curdlanivorans TaxID=1492769 RepID=A0ABV8V457_9GAMM|nr:hypothetical protein [Simiduia curdlanivorans]MDN3637364.1 hypothetical protein [Simiduia curdlanivorans]